jgi:hypothetical protein
MAHLESSNSADFFDSAGFDDFMNASKSSDEDTAFRLPQKKPEVGKPRFTDFSLPASSDPYGFDIDLTSVKAPKPSDFKKKPVPKVEPKPPAKQDKSGAPFSQFSSMLNMMKEFNPYESESEISDNTYRSQDPSSEHFEDVEDRPSLKVVNWSDVKDQLVESESFPEIKTEVFRTDVASKISLSKKFMDDAISVSDSYPAHPIKEEVAEDSEPQESLPEDDYESDFIAESSVLDSLRSSPLVNSSGRVRSPYAYGSSDIKISGSSSGEHSHPRNMLELIRAKAEDPRLEPKQEPYKPAPPVPRDTGRQLGAGGVTPTEQKPVTPQIYETKPAETREFTPESAQEVLYLKQRVIDLQRQLETKQTQVYEYEREQITKNFSRIEENALEKLKAQLREANHKIDLYKIETEELIKQVDYSEAKVRDLEVENDAVKSDLERKAKLADERMRRSEVLTEERTKIEARKEAQRLTDELSSQLEAALHELEFMKERAERAENESRELRLRLQTVKEKEGNLEALQHQNFALQSKLKQGDPKPPAGTEWQKEIDIQEQLIRGYQKENERLVDEVKSLKAQMSADQKLLYAENRRFEGLRDKLIKDHGGVLIKENISDISSLNELAGGTVINKEEFLALKERASRLDRQLREAQALRLEREQELVKELERLRKANQDLELRNTAPPLGGTVGIDEASLQFEREMQAMKGHYEEQLAGVSAKLTWYIENQQLLEQKDKEVQELKAEVNRLSAKPAPNSVKVTALEKQVKSLETALSQKDPNSISAMIRATKNTPETNAAVKKLQERVKQLEAELKDKDVEQENMVRSLKQEYESMRHNMSKRDRRGRTGESVVNLRIQELEKQVEDTKTYYINKLSEVRGPAAHEQRRPQVMAKEHDSAPLQSSSTASFMMSEAGLAWSRICIDLGEMKKGLTGPNSNKVIAALERLIESLDFCSSIPNFTSLKVCDRLVDRCMELSSLLNKSPVAWDAVQQVFQDSYSLVVCEISRVAGTAPAEPAEMSDFSDDDFSFEEIEGRLAFEAVEALQERVEVLDSAAAGRVSVVQMTAVVKKVCPQLNSSQVNALLKRLPIEHDKIAFETFVAQLRGKPSAWWRSTLVHDRPPTLSPELARQAVKDKCEEFAALMSWRPVQVVEGVFAGELFLTPRLFKRRLADAGLRVTQDEFRALLTELTTGSSREISSEGFLNWLKPKPKAAWLPETERKVSAAPDPGVQRDPAAEQRALKAEQRVRDLEAQLYSKDQSAKVTSLQTELTQHLASLERLRTENENLKLDKQRLETHIERTPQVIGTAEFVALQRKIEVIEDNHYRRERELKTRLESVSLTRDQEFEVYKKKVESDKAAMQRTLTSKNKELQEIRGELDFLLKEIDELRGGQ